MNCDAMSLAEASRNTKVSQFPVPVRPPRTRKRGAENNKKIFIDKMDKVYFSIVKLSDIMEDLEPSDQPSDSDEPSPVRSEPSNEINAPSPEISAPSPESRGELSLEKVQGGRCDELNVKNVLQENVGERDLGLNELSQAKSRGGAELGKDTRRTV